MIDFEKNGYRKYSSKHTKPYSECLWQKRIDDEYGVRYYITIYEYSYTETPSYEGDSQFVMLTGNIFNVQYLSIKDLEDVEVFYARVWKSLGCAYHKIFDELIDNE